MAVGGSVFLGYDILMEYIRGHETATHPRILDHLAATCIIGTIGGAYATNSIRGAAQGFLFVGLNLGLLSHWLMEMGIKPGAALQKPVSFHYDPDVTKEEKERIEMLDQLDILAYNM